MRKRVLAYALILSFSGMMNRQKIISAHIRELENKGFSYVGAQAVDSDQEEMDFMNEVEEWKRTHAIEIIRDEQSRAFHVWKKEKEEAA